MPASTRPECTSRTTLHDVTAAAVGEIRTFRSGDSHGVAFDLGGITVFPDGRRTAERIGNAVQLGERIARDARRCAHAHRRLLRTEQLAQAVATANERAAIATLGRAA